MRWSHQLGFAIISGQVGPQVVLPDKIVPLAGVYVQVELQAGFCDFTEPWAGLHDWVGCWLYFAIR